MEEKKVSQGAAAVRNGQAAEKSILPVLGSCGFDIFTETQVEKQPELVKGKDRYILKNSKYTSIYGNPNCRTEYVIVDKGRRVRVEVRFQSVAGSVDEKMPYMLLNAIMAYPEKEVVLVVDGNGYRSTSRQWVQDRLDENWLDYKSKGKDIKLVSIGDFLSWVSKEFAA